jgi:plastocyanin
MKHPEFLKPIGSIVGLAAATGIIAWVAFGFVSPDTYMIPQQVTIEEPSEDLTPSGPIFAIQILEGSTEEGNPDYGPDVAVVTQGHTVEWTNEDSIVHTVTSEEGFGEIFDSSLIDAGDVFTLDTTNLEVGEYKYLCSLHAWMVATLVIEEPKEAIKVIIPEGAAIPDDGQIFYDPQVIDVTVGSTIAWDNVDNTVHTVTSGEPPVDADGIFDSEMMVVGAVFEYTFTDAGSFNYYCTFHPWMVGTVNVE